MFNKVVAWLKARWTWSKGLCPACRRDYTNRSTAWASTCDVCHGHTDDLTIWSRFRHRPKSEDKCHHCTCHTVSDEPVTITRKADDATVVRED